MKKIIVILAVVLLSACTGSLSSESSSANQQPVPEINQSEPEFNEILEKITAHEWNNMKQAYDDEDNDRFGYNDNFVSRFVAPETSHPLISAAVEFIEKAYPTADIYAYEYLNCYWNEWLDQSFCVDNMEYASLILCVFTDIDANNKKVNFMEYTFNWSCFTEKDGETVISDDNRPIARQCNFDYGRIEEGVLNRTDDREGAVITSVYYLYDIADDIEKYSIVSVSDKGNKIRIRTSPEIKDDNILGYSHPDWYYFIYEKRNDGQYTWYRIGKDMWVANNGTWLIEMGPGEKAPIHVM